MADVSPEAIGVLDGSSLIARTFLENPADATSDEICENKGGVLGLTSAQDNYAFNNRLNNHPFLSGTMHPLAHSRQWRCG